MLDVVLGVVVALLTFMLITPIGLCLYDLRFGTSYSCRIWGWHNGKGGTKSFDGCSVHAICSKCDKEVMQDSQGNWF